MSSFAAVIGGFATSDMVDLRGFTYASGSMTSSFAGGVLSLGNGISQAQLSFVGGYVTSNFALSKDAGTGTMVTFHS